MASGSENGLNLWTETVIEQACDPCKFTGKQVESKGFCKSCEGYLCSDCIKAHQQSRDTRGHKISKLDDGSKNGHGNLVNARKFVKCDAHHNSIESFCSDHDALCCHQCVSTTHHKCVGLVPLRRAAVRADRREVTKVSHELEHLLSKFHFTEEEQNDSLRRIDTHSKRFDESVQKFRKAVNKLIDKLEVALVLKKTEICSNEKTAVAGRHKQCGQGISVLKEALENFSSITKHISAEDTFIALKKVRSVIQKYENIHSDLVDKQTKFTLKFVPNNDILAIIDSLGSLVVRSSVEPVGTNELAIVGLVPDKRLEKCAEVDVRAASDVNVCTITGCVYLSDNRLVLADETNKSVKILDASYKIISTYKMTAPPWDIVALSDTEIAVRSSFSDKDEDENKIQVLSLSKNNCIKKDRDFKVDGRPRAIEYQHPFLYIACSEGKEAHIVLVDQTGRTVKRIKPPGGVLNQPQYLTIDAMTSTVYISDFHNGIIGLDENGSIRFQFKDTHVSEYGGITIDTSGDVYICAGKPYGIYKVGKGEAGLAPLVTWEDSTIDPQAILYNKHNNTFLVTACNANTAYVFSYIQ